LVKGVHREPRTEHKEVRRDQDTEGRESLGEAYPSQLAGHQAAQRHHRGAGQRGEEVQGEKRVAEQPVVSAATSATKGGKST
jgi:hypothetical protein